MTSIPFIHPFTGICAGPTGCGKTELMKQIILNSQRMINPVPKRIIWYYAESQPALEQSLLCLGNIEFRQTLPEISEFDGSVPVLLVVDDFMSECNVEIT